MLLVVVGKDGRPDNVRVGQRLGMGLTKKQSKPSGTGAFAPRHTMANRSRRRSRCRSTFTCTEMQIRKRGHAVRIVSVFDTTANPGPLADLETAINGPPQRFHSVA